jgi:hypothetical protein
VRSSFVRTHARELSDNADHESEKLADAKAAEAHRPPPDHACRRWFRRHGDDAHACRSGRYGPVGRRRREARGQLSCRRVEAEVFELVLAPAVADSGNSNRAFHTVTVHSAVPWADDVPELIDELAAEKLPAALMDPILTERRARHEQRRAAAAARAEAKARVTELEPRLDQLDAEQLDELERLADVAHGQYTTDAWQLRDKVGTRRRALADASSDEGPSDAGETSAAHGPPPCLPAAALPRRAASRPRALEPDA